MDPKKENRSMSGSQDLRAKVFSGEESQPLLLIAPNNNQNKNVNRKTYISI